MNPVTLSKRLSYSASDMAGQLIFTFISFYLLKFYTDVVGLSAAVSGTILLIARFTDAVDTPLWGIIFDKTRSRLGKSRPWFLWLCFPFAIFGFLTFLAPDLGSTAKVWYAGGTYIICSILYTGINTPVTSILSALTPDPRQRVILTSFRMVGSKAGVLLVNASAWPLVAWLGQGNDKKGFLLAMPIFAVGSVLLYLLAFWQLEEQVPEERKSLSVRESVGAIKGNWPWIIIFSSSFCFWIAFIARISMVPYYFQYNWDRKDLVPLVNSLDVISLGAILLIPLLCKWTPKRNIWAWGLAGAVVSQVLLYFAAVAHSLPWLMVGWCLGILTSGAAMAMPFSMLSDSVDYGEWKTGIRAPGFLTAIGIMFAVKAGAGLGSALPAWTIGAFDYVPNVAQTARSLMGIEIGFIWIPAAFYVLSLIPVLFYKQYEMLEPQVHADLDRRRAAASH
jgi:sugar (glycoside-pentoside-hexuronide) transporter